MIGVRKLNAMVMMNWMPTIAHSVRCQLAGGWQDGLDAVARRLVRGAAALSVAVSVIVPQRGTARLFAEPGGALSCGRCVWG